MANVRLFLCVVIPLVACDQIDMIAGEMPGGTPGGTPGEVPEEAPRYNRSECGSLPASNLAFSNTRGNATTFALQQLVGGRVDPQSMTNKEHYWKIQLAKGAYHLVADSARSDGSDGNIGLHIVRLDQSGAEQAQIASGNEIARRYRDAGFFMVATSQVVQFKVTGNFGMEDYLLGVFANGDAVPSPRFQSCPTITPLSLGQAQSFVLAAGGTANEEQWFAVRLELGDYKFLSEAKQADGVTTNLIYSLDLLDQFGQESRGMTVLSANAIDTSFVSRGMRSVGEATPFWVRVRNGHNQLNMTLTVSR
jgi:hypothetical protein